VVHKMIEEEVWGDEQQQAMGKEFSSKVEVILSDCRLVFLSDVLPTFVSLNTHLLKLCL
jgi:hypothetical protein